MTEWFLSTILTVFGSLFSFSLSLVVDREGEEERFYYTETLTET